jgi:hypothetical protein
MFRGIDQVVLALGPLHEVIGYSSTSPDAMVPLVTGRTWSRLAQVVYDRGTAHRSRPRSCVYPAGWGEPAFRRAATKRPCRYQ